MLRLYAANTAVTFKKNFGSIFELKKVLKTINMKITQEGFFRNIERILGKKIFRIIIFFLRTIIKDQQFTVARVTESRVNCRVNNSKS